MRQWKQETIITLIYRKIIEILSYTHFLMIRNATHAAKIHANKKYVMFIYNIYFI